MGLWDTYNYYFFEIADKRTIDYPLMTSPVPLLLISFAYLYFIFQCGPRYMKNRQPYSLKTFMRGYNVFQIFINAYMIYKILDLGWYEKIWIYCYPFTFGVEPMELKMISVSYLLMIIKVVDYIETVVFVLRKKNSQISFLHLYHHLSTVWLAWIVVKYFVVGMALFFMLVNCFVHVVMYTYYFVASYGPTAQRFTKAVKPFITIMQMVQFVILILYSLQSFYLGCKDTAALALMMITNLVINFILFYNFYQQTYKKKTKKA